MTKHGTCKLKTLGHRPRTLTDLLIQSHIIFTFWSSHRQQQRSGHVSMMVPRGSKCAKNISHTITASAGRSGTWCGRSSIAVADSNYLNCPHVVHAEVFSVYLGCNARLCEVLLASLLSCWFGLQWPDALVLRACDVVCNDAQPVSNDSSSIDLGR